jgi:TRAP-type C4-dicarboxylate transport system permease small subunit
MKKTVEVYLKFCRSMANITMSVTTIVLFIMVLIVNYDIFVRNVFNDSGISAVEISGYCLTFICFGGIAYTFVDDGFIRVDILYMRMTTKTKIYVDLINYILSTVFISLLTKSVWDMIIYSWETQQRSNGLTRWVLFWPRLIMGVGLTVLLLNLIGLTIRQIINVLDQDNGDTDYNCPATDVKTKGGM